ncbi:MAG TPA: DegQ family serine endoprotease [Bryobacteraceae bacterium]|nr:DegQ family serine endoprotease [Bryobacteraceae bacterium]
MKILVTVVIAWSLAACSRTGSEPTRISFADRDAAVSWSRPSSTPPQSYADTVDKVSPAVVTIRSARRVRAPQQFPFIDDPFFRRFFGFGNPPRNRGGGGAVERGLGSGVIVDANGDILTNHHVVDGAEQITVEMPNRKTYSAKLVGSDPPSDLAVLRINASNLPILTLGNSDQVKVGDVCLAIGNPLGIGETVTAGIISAKSRATGLSDGNFEDFLQTDAPINQGNSGGALVNTSGELIGINSQILSTTGGNIGIGFAIPSNMAKTVMAQLVKNGKVRRGQLGVSIQPVTSDIAANLGLGEARGVLVSSVTPSSPADKGGIKVGDVILAMNGQPTNSSNELRNRVAAAGPGADVSLTVWRSGKEQEVKTKLTELTLEGAQNPQQPSAAPAGAGQLGLGVRPLTPEDSAPRGVTGLVVESVDPAGPAAEAGIQVGDVISEVNRQPVRSSDDLRAALQKTGSRPALLLLHREGQAIFLTITPR